MYYKFSFDIEPISLNMAYRNVPSKGRVKTNKALRWIDEFNLQLLKYEYELEELKEKFNPLRQCITVEQTYFIKNLFNKKETISQRSGDVDNYAKIPNDTLFKAIGIDDKFITDLVLKKRPGNGTLTYTIKVKDLISLSCS